MVTRPANMEPPTSKSAASTLSYKKSGHGIALYDLSLAEAFIEAPALLRNFIDLQKATVRDVTDKAAAFVKSRYG